MSRFRAFLLVAAFAALATAFAACGGSDDSGSSNEDPQQVIDTATLEGVESGDLDLSLNVTAEGSEGGNLDLSLSGPFQAEGKDLPQLDLSVEASGAFDDENIDFAGGLTLLKDSAFVEYDGTEYEVDPTTFGFVKAAIEEATQQQGAAGANPADVTACQEAATGIEVGSFVENLTNEGSVDVEGTSTTQVSGDLNVPGAIDAIVKLAEDPACSAQLEAAGSLPIAELEAAKGVIGEALKTAHVDLYVGEDGIIRKAAADLAIEPPEEASEGPSSVDLSFDLVLSGVNEKQSFSAPSGAKPLNELFQKLDVNPIELLEFGSSGGLEGLLEGSTPGSSSGSGSAAPTAPSVEESQKYLDCLKGADTPTDLQQCAALLK